MPSPLDRWALDPDVIHLNHGSYGGCPRLVIDAAAGFRARLEAAPMRFLVLEWQAELDRARAALAAFVRAPDSRLVFVPSSTTGIAIALASVKLRPGDEVITTDHAYRAVLNQLHRAGAQVTAVRVPIPFDADALVDAVTRAITARTRLALFDHITSPTALVLPIERLLAPFHARAITTIVDGAHAPGQVELDVGAVGATYYIGNNHKWLCAPKGSGFLVVAEGAAAVPVVTSHGASPEYGPPNRLHAELDWSGTHDPSVHLAVPTALAAVAAEGGGWPAVIAHNHALAVAMRARLVEGLGAGGASFAPDDALGAMAAVPITIPAGVEPFALQTELLADDWEVAIVEHATGNYVRVSAHLYNHVDQADDLVQRLRAASVVGRRLS